MSSRNNPFVFVVGCPRSGTTLLQRILNNHPLLAVANDSHFIPRCLEKNDPRSVPAATAGRPIPLTPELARGVREYHRFHRIGLSEVEAAGLARNATTYQQYVGGIYDHFAQKAGKPLSGEKTPDYVRHIPLLHGLFPEARFVHIVRDGRDVALSTLEWAKAKKGPGRFELWESQPVATCALWWRWMVECGRDAGREIGHGHYHEVSYEKLVADPAGEAERICAFLRLEQADAMLEYHVGREKADPRLSAKRRWLRPTPGLRDWRTQMDPADLALFEALTADLLDDLGLECRETKITAETSRNAADAQLWWKRYHRDRAQRFERKTGSRPESTGPRSASVRSPLSVVPPWDGGS